MEILTDLFRLTISGLTIAGIIIFLGKLIINKGSDLIIQNHKNNLEILKTEHQIKFTQLHNERAQIIKTLYTDLFELERTLRDLTSFFQGPDWNIKKELDQKALQEVKSIENFIEKNRIYFSEDFCLQILESLNKYENVIDKMLDAKHKSIIEKANRNFAKDEKFSIQIWKEAHLSVKNEIKELRLELAESFRKIIEF